MVMDLWHTRLKKVFLKGATKCYEMLNLDFSDLHKSRAYGGRKLQLGPIQHFVSFWILY